MNPLSSTQVDIKLAVGHKRIYFYHIRRVGGTSLNQSFFQLRSSHPELASANIRRSKKKIIHLNGTRYIGANRKELESGDYFYGFSHIPSYTLRLPPQTFTITLLRDPVARILSHYKMVADYAINGVERYWLPLERQWLGSSFGDFYNNLPRERLYAQLFMFSQTFSISEAVDNIRRCDFVFATERYALGLAKLSGLLGLTLLMRHSHSNRIDVNILPSEIDNLRELMEPEYSLLRQLEELSHDR